MESLRVLIVEDDALSAQDVEMMLNNIGHSCCGIVADGRVAVEKAMEERPDIVLMDISLKGGSDGIEAAEQIYNRLNIPVIYISGYSDKETLSQVKETNPYGFIVKPIEEENLWRTLELAVYKHNMEKALKESEERYRELFNHISSGVIVYKVIGDGQDFIIKDFNRAAERITLRKREDVIGRSGPGAFPGLKEIGLIEVFKRVWKTGKDEQTPIAPYRDKRVTYWAERHVYRLSNGDIAIIFNDLTGKIKIERRLETERSFSNALIESSPAFFVAIDQNGEVLMMNRSMLEALGYKLSEVIGKDYIDMFIPYEERVRVGDVFKDILENENKVVVKNHVLKKNGQTLNIEWRGSPVIGPDGGVKYFFGVGIDITEKEKIENVLRQSEEKFHNIFEHSPIGIALCNRSGEILDFNSALSAILGLEKREDGYGLNIFSDLYLDESLRESLNRGELYKTEILYDFDRIRSEKKLMSSRKGIAYLEIMVNPFSGDNEEEDSGFRCLLHVQDITPKKEMEERARLQQQQLIQADRLASLGVLVTGVAHEINNPNQSIMLNTSFLKEAWLGILPILDEYYREEGDFLIRGIEYSEIRSRMTEYHGIIEECSKKIDSIVQDLKTFARQDRDGSMSDIDINNVIQTAVALISPFIKKSTENFSVEYGEKLPPVKGNSQKLGQVIVNLIENACQALKNKTDKIVVRTYLKIEENAVVVEVEDHGCGIPLRYLSKIKDPFFTTKRSEGTGLGLSVSNSIVSEHGGELLFESEEGKGTVARVILPANIKRDGLTP